MEELLRHILATLAYRFSKCVNNVDNSYGEFKAGKEVRSPAEIVNHMNSLMEFSVSFVTGKERQEVPQAEFNDEVQRFFTRLNYLDQLLLENELSVGIAKKLIQGPLSDALTHVGQLAMLRRLNDQPIERESYVKADIQTGVIRPTDISMNNN